MRLKNKLALFNLGSKLILTLVFILVLPWLAERINLRQIDRELVRKREQVIGLIGSFGIEPFIAEDSLESFGSYNILKEEFISIEKSGSGEYLNYIEVATRLIDEEEIQYRVLHYSLIIDEEHYILEVGKSTESIVQLKKNMYSVILLFMALLMVFTLLADLRFAGMVLHPLGYITGKLKELKNPGGFNRSPVKSTTSDFIQLDQALTGLMDRINLLIEREREITVNISHELRTPVSVIRSKLENLLLDPDIQPGMAEKIEESLLTLQRLQALVNALLMIARLESRQYLNEDEVEAGALLKEVVGELLPLAEDKGVKMICDNPEPVHLKHCNRSLLFSMLYNVVNNSIKNTPAGGEIICRCGKENGNQIVSIEDTGKGLSEQQMEHLFSRFKSNSTAEDGGTGIGLAITKAIADFHGFEIKLQSKMNEGTSFFFILNKTS